MLPRALIYECAVVIVCILFVIAVGCAGTGGGGQPADSAAAQQGGGNGGGGGASPAPNVGSPQSISLKSDKTQVNVRDVGGDSVASITATVVDGLGRAVPGSNVIFTISGAASGGGATIESPKVADSNGDASTKFTAGTVSGTLIITAQVPGTSVQAAYSQLTVNAGPPNVISLSSTLRNVDGMYHDGVESKVQAIVPDKYGNPVKDGTPIYFRTDYCYIEAMCTTAKGICDVKFLSSKPRPNEDANGNRIIFPPAYPPPYTSDITKAERVTITATTVGMGGLEIKRDFWILVTGPARWAEIEDLPPNGGPPRNRPTVTFSGTSTTYGIIMNVWDEYGNPPAADTKVIVTATAGGGEGKVTYDSGAEGFPVWLTLGYSPPVDPALYPDAIRSLFSITKNGDVRGIYEWWKQNPWPQIMPWDVRVQ